MAPPPATIAQIHERFPAVAFAGTLGGQQFSAQQTTLNAAVTCKGIGLHSGAELTMRLVPAAAIRALFLSGQILPTVMKLPFLPFSAACVMSPCRPRLEQPRACGWHD